METKSHHNIYIPSLGKNYYLPKELRYCDSQEFETFTELYLLFLNENINYETFRIQLIYKFLNIKPTKKKLTNTEQETIYSTIYEISELIDSFFIIEKNILKLKNNIIENPILFVQPFLTKYKGPKARLINTTFGQFQDAQNLYQLYNHTKKTKFLFQLLSTYYTKKYNKNKVETISEQWGKKIPLHKAFGFMLFYESTQQYITSSKVLWEGQVIDLSIIFNSENKSKSTIPGLGTKAIAFLIAESGVFGNYTELTQAPLWEVLLRLYDIHKRYLDEKRESQKQLTEQ